MICNHYYIITQATGVVRVVLVCTEECVYTRVCLEECGMWNVAGGKCLPHQQRSLILCPVTIFFQ